MRKQSVKEIIDEGHKKMHDRTTVLIKNDCMFDWRLLTPPLKPLEKDL